MLSLLVICGTLVVFVSGAPYHDTQVYTNNIENETELDLGNWMGLLPETHRNVPIIWLAIPGTHDSFTKEISPESEVSPDGNDLYKALQDLPFVKDIIAKWAKTQAFGVVQQLQAGIRFFDLRFCRNSSEEKLYFCHAMYSTEVTQVLTDMADYLSSHPKEVVILDCQHFYDFTNETHPKVISLLQNTFANKVIPYTTSIDGLTLSNLEARGLQVLVIYREKAYSGQSFLWPTEAYPTPWYNTMKQDYLIDSLDQGLRERSFTFGYVSQLVLTPQPETILTHLSSSLRQKCAVEFQTNRMQWIQRQAAGKRGVNVIIIDFSDLEDNQCSEAVVRLNQKLNITTLHASDGMFTSVGNFLRSLSWIVFGR